MSNKVILDDGDLDQVVGGLFIFHSKSLVLDWTHPDGSVSYHKILDFDKAWKRCKELEAGFVPESKIIADLTSKGYLQ